jgi:hypothetical protein
VPSVTGAVIPEPLFDRDAYRGLLESIYADLAPLDPEGTLRHEWVNARGCIARFDRMALEIRLLDVQECPRADLAIAAGASTVLRALCQREGGPADPLRALDTTRLARILVETTTHAGAAKIDDAAYLEALGVGAAAHTAEEVWRELLARHPPSGPAAAELQPALERILEEGCLARRLLRRLGPDPGREALSSVYRELAGCLRDGEMFHA